MTLRSISSIATVLPCSSTRPLMVDTPATAVLLQDVECLVLRVVNKRLEKCSHGQQLTRFVLGLEFGRHRKEKQRKKSEQSLYRDVSVVFFPPLRPPMQQPPPMPRATPSLVHDMEQVRTFGAMCRVQLEQSKEGRLAGRLLVFSVQRRYKPEQAPVTHHVVRALLTQKHDLATEVANVDARDTYMCKEREALRDDMSVHVQLNPRNQMQALLHLHSRTVSDALQAKGGWKSGNMPTDLSHELLVAFEHASTPCDRQLTAVVLRTNNLERVREFCTQWTPAERTEIDFVIAAPDAHYILFRQVDLPRNTHRLMAAFHDKHPSIAVEWECTGLVPVPGTLAEGHPVRLVSRSELFGPETEPDVIAAAAAAAAEPTHPPGLSPPRKRKQAREHNEAAAHKEARV
jgi:hypothetical protein